MLLEEKIGTFEEHIYVCGEEFCWTGRAISVDQIPSAVFHQKLRTQAKKGD